MTLREQLARKRAHSTSLTFPLGDDGAKAKTAVDQAETHLSLVQRVGLSGDEHGIASRELDEARAAYRKVSLTLRFRGLTEEERDALTSAHPATPEQLAKHADDGGKDDDKPVIDRSSFLPAALAICVIDSDLTDADWAAELASQRWTAGEKLQLFRAVMTATHSEPADGLGKGFATTR